MAQNLETIFGVVPAFEVINFVIVITATSAALISAIYLMRSHSRLLRENKELIKMLEQGAVDVDGLDDQVRLPELRAEYYRNKSILRLSSTASFFLIVSQFVVGGALATTFVQETFSPPLIGSLGLLVLISSIIQQRFRPNVMSAKARERMFRSRQLIRGVEDDLFDIRNSAHDALSIPEVRRRASDGLTELEMVELERVTKVVHSKGVSGDTDGPDREVQDQQPP